MPYDCDTQRARKVPGNIRPPDRARSTNRRLRSFCLWALAYFALASSSACSSAARQPPHVIDRRASKICTERPSSSAELATLLVPSGVSVVRYQEPPGSVRLAFPSAPPVPCAGPARFLALPGRGDWNVWVETADEDAKLELQLELHPAEVYELRISEGNGTVTWELIRTAKQP